MRRSLALPALVVAGALTLAGCSGGGTPSATEPAPGATGGGNASGELTPISVGVIPIVDVAAIYLGVEEGFFEEEGLDVTLELAQGGAAIVPAVVSNEYQFGFSNVTSLLLATNNGVPLQAVGAGNYTTGQDPDIGAVVVPADSDIQSAADLAGRTVAVNTLNNIGDSTVRNVVDEAGGDSSGIQFVEMGFPDMPAAISGGQVEAAWILEPHLTRALQAGARVVSWNFAETDPDLMISAYFTSQPFAAESPEVVEAFTRALNRSLDFAEQNPDATRAILGEYTQIDPAVAEAMTMPRFSSEFSTDTVQLLADLALEYGMVDQEIDFSTLVP